jgi:hypothetical protein
VSTPVQSREVFLSIADQQLGGSGPLSGSLARFQALKMLLESQLGRFGPDEENSCRSTLTN